MSTVTATARELIRDIDIQQWVWERYGFVPHPVWINHCKELFLGQKSTSHQIRKAWHECPPDKREAIGEAFRYFGLGEEAGVYGGSKWVQAH